MAEAYMINEIRHIGGAHYYAEERNHPECIECVSGCFIRVALIFSGCETVGDYFKWLEDPNHHLEIRYWNEMPTAEERLSTPWRVYVVFDHSEIKDKTEYNISEDEFNILKERYPIYKVSVETTYSSLFKEAWKCMDPKMDILRM